MRERPTPAWPHTPSSAVRTAFRGSPLLRSTASWIFACCWFAAGCATTTVELHPAKVARDCTSDDDHAGALCLCGLAQMGTACHAEPANSIKSYPAPTPPLFVGWSDNYDPGSGICPCWEWVSTFSRGYVKFEIPGLVDFDRITYASLRWSRHIEEGQSSNSCLERLYEATGPWVRGKTPRTLVYDGLDVKAAAGGFVGLADLVTKWQKDPGTNFGLMLAPKRESTAAKSDARCVDKIDDLTLVFKYRKKKPQPWPS